MRAVRRLSGLLLLAALCAPLAAPRANDTSAALGTGGLQFVRNEQVEMRSEDLFISETEIRVRYVFRNTGAKDVTTLVAFPLPDIPNSETANFVVPRPEMENFLDFHTVVDGTPVRTEVERRVFSLGLDRTRLLEELKVPLSPYGMAAGAALDALPAETKARLVALGIARIEEMDIGKGMKPYTVPGDWTLKTTYYWNQTFPAGKELVIEHRYRPSVGSSVGTRYAKDPTDAYDVAFRARATRRYCLDDDFFAAVRRGKGQYTDNTISYILGTAANWAGPIGDFTLTVDKGAADNIVSFCGTNVRKVGPTTFQVRQKDFVPIGDLDFLILKPVR